MLQLNMMLICNVLASALSWTDQCPGRQAAVASLMILVR